MRIHRLGVTLAALLALPLATLAGCASSGKASARVTSVDGVACSANAKPPSGMKVLIVARLPAQAVSTLKLIAVGGPYPYAEDGTVFGNYQSLLPREPYGYYREYTVTTPGSRTRGERRVVTGSGGQDYYTPDHYDSFDWIACG